jgi:hypothetical protein
LANVRDGDAIADAGGAQTLALQQHIENGPFVQPGQFRRTSRQLLQRLFLAAHPQVWYDALRADQINDLHHRSSW